MSGSRLIWTQSPSMLMLIPDIFKMVFVGLIGLIVALVAKTTHLDGLMDNFVLNVLFGITKSSGSYLLDAIVVIYLFFIGMLIGKVIRISYETYGLDEECFHYRNGVFSETQGETQLFRMIDFEVEKPFFLRIFGFGNLTVFSNDPSLDNGFMTKSFITPDGNKGMRLVGIKDPENVKRIFKEQVAEVRSKRGMRTTELI